MALGLGAPVVAGLYMVYGPLGQKIVLPAVGSTDEEAQEDEANRTGSGRVVVSRPEWAGGLFDLNDDPTVAALSLSCTFCVFGWNMERLGLGNMYVHAFTFALLCAAPLLVFAVAATPRSATSSAPLARCSPCSAPHTGGSGGRG
jgi:Cys-rich protein (TIGR01571 family)